MMLTRLVALFRRRRLDRELDDEIRFHLQSLQAEFEAQGLSPAAARLAARRAFGTVELMKDEYRDRRGFVWLEALARDVRYAARGLRRTPGFTAAAVLSLALGIGMNTAIFSVFRAMLLRMLPVERPEQLVSLYRTGGWGSGFLSYPLYEALRDQTDVFDGVLARNGAQRVRFAHGANDRADFMRREYVSGNYFTILGLKPVLGRVFNEREDAPEKRKAVVVLSYDAWRDRFGMSPHVLGRTVHIGEQAVTVVGVAPPGFHGVELETRTEAWVPLGMAPGKREDPGMHWLWPLARLKPGVPESRAQAEVDTILARFLADHYGSKPDSVFRRKAFEQRVHIRPGGIGVSQIRAEFERPLRLLMGAVVAVLLIACVNVANLLLARGAARRREIALRLSIGAGRERLIAHLLAESGLIAVIGATAGLLIAAWMTRGLVGLLPFGSEALRDRTALDPGILAFTALTALAAVFFVGLVPALEATRIDTATALRDAAVRGVRLRIGIRKALVASQVALSVILVVGAGLFVRSLAGLKWLDPGFRNGDVVRFGLDTPRNYTPKQEAALRDRLLERLGNQPGVVSVSYGFPGPYLGGSSSASIRVPGSDKTSHQPAWMDMQAAAPRYFETIGSPPLSGREFEAGDIATSRKVAIVNEAFAREFFGGADAVGHVFGFDDSKPDGGDPVYIVGMVRDIRHKGVREKAVPVVYTPVAQSQLTFGPTFLVRSVRRPDAVIADIRREVAAIDSSVGLVEPTTLRGAIDQSLYRERMLAALGGVFGVLALLLAGIGIYGVVAYAVSQRTSEIGVRVALGATRMALLWMVLRQGLGLIVAGIAVGLPVSLAVNRLGAALLYGIRPTDPLTIAAGVGMLVAVGLIAGLIPSRRAAAIDPMQALRAE